MVRPTEGDEEVGTETCKGCGALYHVTIRQNPTRAHDWYNCAVCGRLLMEWDSSSAPSFTLLGGSGRTPRKPR